MNVRYCIPSYKRAGRVKTLDMLKRYNIPKEDIYIFTQCDEDYKAYLDLYGNDCNVQRGIGTCVADNRNNILKHFSEGTLILMIDDDVSKIFKLNARGKLDELEDLRKFVESAFLYTMQNKAMIFTIKTVANPMFMSNKVNNRQFGAGGFFGIINNHKYSFSKDYKVLEDVELCLRTIKGGYNCVRFENYCINAQRHTKGGCEDNWDNNEEELYRKKILLEYGRFITYKNKAIVMKKERKRNGR